MPDKEHTLADWGVVSEEIAAGDKADVFDNGNKTGNDVW